MQQQHSATGQVDNQVKTNTVNMKTDLFFWLHANTKKMEFVDICMCVCVCVCVLVYVMCIAIAYKFL